MDPHRVWRRYDSVAIAVSDVTPRLSTEEMADLSALADGTLPPGRRAEVEARVAASPELADLVERQRRAVRAVEELAMEEVPESLEAAVAAHRRGDRRRRRRRPLLPRIVLAGAAAIAVVLVAAVVLSGGPGAPSVADAAQLATQAPNGPAPPPAGTSGTRLAAAVDGVAFPDFARAYGWHAAGVRHGHIDGRAATVVQYRKGPRRLGYVIVAGAGLARPAAARTTVIRRVEYQTLRLNGRPAVTWRRGGHTCVLVGQAPRAELLKLASWPLGPGR
jgi:anti-sigma factor RsiW